jgi:Flp pilus assembly protein TadD
MQPLKNFHLAGSLSAALLAGTVVGCGLAQKNMATTAAQTTTAQTEHHSARRRHAHKTQTVDKPVFGEAPQSDTSEADGQRQGDKPIFGPNGNEDR